MAEGKSLVGTEFTPDETWRLGVAYKAVWIAVLNLCDQLNVLQGRKVEPE